MADFRTHSPDRIITTWAGININGYAADTFIEIERNEDSFMLYKGALDDGCRARNLNRSGKITITLMASAPVNDDLAAKAQEDEDFGTGYGPFQCIDLSGNMVVEAAEAWVSKRPKIERGKEAGTIQWVFECNSMIVTEGGNTI